MRLLASIGSSFAVFMASDLAGHSVSILDVLICAAAMVASFLALEMCDLVLGP